MGSLTAKLLGVRPNTRSPWRERFAIVADRLVSEYGVPSLGNFRNPVKEILYILLSAKTTDAQYRRTHRKLMAAYPKLTDLAVATIADVRKCIESGGLASKRSAQLIGVARELLAACGRYPTRFLRKLDAEGAYNLISGLPGMGPKSALCVIMYSLDFDAFPVDVNVQRIAERMGAIPKGLKHYQAQRRLAEIVPDGRSRELHIGLVVHGRAVCLPRKPDCGNCCLNDMCKTGRKKRIAKEIESLE